MVAFVLATAAARALPAQVRHEFTEVRMGVPVRMVVHAASDSGARTAARSAYARMAELEDVMSDYRPASEVRQLEHRAGAWTAVSAELFAVLARAVEIARASDGAFDPTVGPLVALWREARHSGALPAPAALDSARARTGWALLELDPTRQAVRLARPGMRLDLGGIAKGYILQEALGTLRAHGVASALVEAGGDVVVGDAPPGRAGWRVEVAGADTALRRVAGALVNGAIATSGPTEQFVEIGGVRYSHVVDPRTGIGLTARTLTTVIAGDGATADALATALGVLGRERGAALMEAFDGVRWDVRAAP